MASSNADLKTRIATQRNEILSYKPGKAVPCDDERVVFPDKLVIGMIDLSGYSRNVVHDLRRALHGDVEASKLAVKRQTSTHDQVEYLTESVSLIIHLPGPALLFNGRVSDIKQDVQDFAGKGCVVLLVDSLHIEYTLQMITAIKEVTGRAPLCGMFNIARSEDIEGAKLEIKKHGITDIYDLSINDDILSDGEQLQWLDFLHGCLCEADVVVLHRITAYQQICEQERKEAKEARKRHDEEIREREEEKKLFQRRVTDLEQKLNESRASRESIVSEYASLKDTMKVEQERRKQSEIAMTENEKKAKQVKEMYMQSEIELEEKLKSKDMRIRTMVENLQRAEETARREVQRLQTEKEEMTKTLESKQHRADTLTEIVQEKGRNESAHRQVVEDLTIENKEDRARFEKEKQSMESSLKKELDSKKQHIEQLERETWKLRTKIQLESEIRSAEQKKKAETPQWMRSFIPWMAAGKQAQSGITSSGDSSSGEIYQMERSNTSQTDAEPPNDEFGDILKQIADDLSEEAKIDSLGSQLGIIQGDIARALKTNMRYEQVTSRGTHLMLKQWREGVSREDERIEMRRALVAAKLLDLADRYVPQRDSVEDQCHIIEDSRQRIDITPSAQGSSEVLTKTHEATLTPDQPHLDDVSSQNQTANKEEAVAASAPSNRERINLDDGEHDADEAMEGEITAQEVQPDFQEPGSAHSNDGYDDIVDALDREMDENDQEPQSAHIDDIDSTRALQISEEPASEKLCCSCCYPFRYSHFR